MPGKPPTTPVPKVPGKPLSKAESVAQRMEGAEGYVKGVYLPDQVDYWMAEELKSLELAILEATKKFGAPLSAKQKGDVLIKVFDKEIKAKNVMKRKYKSHGKEAKDIDASANRGANSKYGYDAVLVEGKEQQEAIENGTEYWSDRLWKKSKTKLPRVYKTKKPIGDQDRNGGYQSYGSRETSPYVVINDMEWAIYENNYGGVVKHEFAHALDLIDSNGKAAIIARNKFVYAQELAKKGGKKGYIQLKGKWGRAYCGRVYGSGAKEGDLIKAGKGRAAKGSNDVSEFGSTATELLTKQKDGYDYLKLGAEWDINPERVAFLKAYMKGRFVK